VPHLASATGDRTVSEAASLKAELACRKAGPAPPPTKEQSMNLPCLGVDIAKVKFNVCLLQFTGKLKHKVFPNNEAGFGQLQEWLKKHQVQQNVR
jgi:hypothetical protein